MSGTNSRRRRWPALGMGAVGLGAGLLGWYGTASAEPIREPLLPTALSKPANDQPNWSAAKKKDAPAAPTISVLPLDVKPLPAPSIKPPGGPEKAPAPRPAPIEVARPAKPIQPIETLPPPSLSQPNFNLRPADPRHTVNPTAPAGPAVPAPPTNIGLKVVPPPALPVSRPRPPELPTAGAGLPGAYTVPVLPTITTPTRTPGVEPMPLPTRQLVMSAVFGAALATAPLRAEDTKAPAPKADASNIQEQLNALKTDLNKLRDDVNQLNSLKDVVLGTKDGTAGTNAGLLKRLSDMEETLKQINAKLGQLDANRSTSAYAGSTNSNITTRAHVRIVNDYPTEMSLMVNGRSYRMQPGESRTVDVPPGGYTYELLHAGSHPTTSNIKDGETVTLRIR